MHTLQVLLQQCMCSNCHTRYCAAACEGTFDHPDSRIDVLAVRADKIQMDATDVFKSLGINSLVCAACFTDPAAVASAEMFIVTECRQHA